MSKHAERAAGLRRAGTALCAALALSWAGLAPGARAGELTVLSCHDGAGDGLGHDGWSISRTADTDMSATDSCGGGGVGTLGLELGANPAGYGNLAGSAWVFQAPAWASIASYAIEIADSYALPSIGAGSGQAYVNASDESDPNYDYRNLGSATLGPTRIARAPGAPASEITLDASCDGQYGPCASNERVARLDMSASEVTLRDPTSPTLSAIGGPLASGATLKGSQAITFTASDGGPGVYSAWLQVDGQPQPAKLLSTNGGWCEALAQSAGVRAFAHPDPCPQSASGELTLDTSALSDGEHSLELLLDDASGNTSVGYATTIATSNASALSAGASGLAQLIQAGPANGHGASASARLVLDTPRLLTRSFARRAFRLRGSLADPHGQPIRGASLEILQQGNGAPARMIGRVSTSADGSFSFAVAAGPPRTVTVAYRAFAGAPAYAAAASVQERVGAGVSLSVFPMQAGSSATITLSGRVASPVPRRGVLVVLLVRYLGHWEPFRDPQTDRDGRFKVRYQFQGARGRFPFRAQVPGAQQGYPYASGLSAPVTVSTH